VRGNAEGFVFVSVSLASIRGPWGCQLPLIVEGTIVVPVRRTVGLAFWITVLSMLVAGCGASRGRISGKVSYQGKPLTAGTVFFQPTQGGKDAAALSSGIGKDGAYQIKNIPLGEYKVYVRTPKADFKMPIPGGKAPASSADTMPGKGDSSASVVEVPEKYGKPDSSGLTYTVKKGDQPFDIDLK